MYTLGLANYKEGALKEKLAQLAQASEGAFAALEAQKEGMALTQAKVDGRVTALERRQTTGFMNLEEVAIPNLQAQYEHLKRELADHRATATARCDENLHKLSQDVGEQMRDIRITVLKKTEKLEDDLHAHREQAEHQTAQLTQKLVETQQ